jgi:hypothetical protein
MPTRAVNRSPASKAQFEAKKRARRTVSQRERRAAKRQQSENPTNPTLGTSQPVTSQPAPTPQPIATISVASQASTALLIATNPEAILSVAKDLATDNNIYSFDDIVATLLALDSSNIIVATLPVFDSSNIIIASLPADYILRVEDPPTVEERTL